MEPRRRVPCAQEEARAREAAGGAGEGGGRRARAQRPLHPLHALAGSAERQSAKNRGHALLPRHRPHRPQKAPLGALEEAREEVAQGLRRAHGVQARSKARREGLPRAGGTDRERRRGVDQERQVGAAGLRPVQREDRELQERPPPRAAREDPQRALQPRPTAQSLRERPLQGRARQSAERNRGEARARRLQTLRRVHRGAITREPPRPAVGEGVVPPEHQRSKRDRSPRTHRQALGRELRGQNAHANRRPRKRARRDRRGSLQVP